MSHSYSPAATFSQMDENKQDLPKKLVEPFGSSCQFESAGAEAFSLSGRRWIQRERERADTEVEGASVVVLWGWEHYSSPGKSSNEGRKFCIV